MVIFKKIIDLQDYLDKRAENDIRPIGFIPTMGALHKGHISLIDAARHDGNLTIASIFVNPTQFNDKEDFKKYPVSDGSDIAMLAEAGCDIVFMPGVDEIYPGGEDKMPVYEFGYLDNLLEGAYRPGHFKGVGQVVARLLDIVQPDNLYMGQKDYQQCMVVKKLISILGREDKIKLVICPTMREADGLAMSSRNRRLTEPQRAVAGVIYQCLVSIQSKQRTDSFDIVYKECKDLLLSKGFAPDYISLADANDLAPLDAYSPDKKMVALIAAKLGDVRLIDNMILN